MAFFTNWQLLIKKIFDFFFSLTVFLILLPIFILIALLVKATSSGPIFFIQSRPGKNMEPFRIIKFRTMTVGAEKYGLNMSESNSRITSVGKLLRRTHLDEMPQLINILKGEMSFVGPRPPLLSQVNQKNNLERQRFLMKPGLAGWAQLKGGNWISWQERVAYDVWYVDHFSLWLDVKIFVLSFWEIIIKGQGLYKRKSDD
jgi:lipopolysaccharide/colanic/teichoic acid biosynthesis glycosyltransferase